MPQTAPRGPIRCTPVPRGPLLRERYRALGWTSSIRAVPPNGCFTVRMTRTGSDSAERSGRDVIAARTLIDASPAAVFGFLADLENHCVLAGPRLEIVSLDGPHGARNGGVMRIRGPLGLRRNATTRVLATTRPREILGRAKIGRHTTARVRWVLERREHRTAVCLSATVESVGIIDRLLLELGARRWLGRAFLRALGRLSDQFDDRPAPELRAAGPNQSPTAAAVAHHPGRVNAVFRQSTQVAARRSPEASTERPGHRGRARLAKATRLVPHASDQDGKRRTSHGYRTKASSRK